MRKTKIICTIGPASSRFETLEKMIEAGMDVVRLNMSHGDHDSHLKIIKAIKTLNQRVRYPVPILLDTQGPEIRTGDVSQDFNLAKDSVVSISVRDKIDVEERSIHINYEDLMNTVSVGDRITVDNGLINLEVLSMSDRHMTCKVLDGGVLKSKRHVNLPGIRVNLPSITEKDEKDILFGMEHDVDFIALSFVREAADILSLQSLLGEKAKKIKIIAKIEDQEGVKNIAEIIEVADGVMVARGDLGVEINIEDLPNVQRQIVRQCSEAGRRVIVATHLLESMIDHPIPTRAEVTDVANAVYEEVDAIMLSGETTVGKYPIKCIEYLDRIAKQTEKIPGLRYAHQLKKITDKQHLAAAAVDLSESLDAAGMVVITRRGFMADFLTNCRGPRIPIYAFTNVSRTRRQLMLNRNVYPFRIALSADPERTLATAFNVLKARASLQSGDKVVVVSDILEGTGIEAIQIRHLP